MSGADGADLGTPAAPAATETFKATLSLPAFSTTIKQNPNPACLSIAGFGDLYFDGALTGYADTRPNQLPFSPAPLPSDRASLSPRA